MLNLFNKKTKFRNEEFITRDELLVISEVSAGILSTIELSELLQRSIDLVVNKYGLLGGILFLVDQKTLYAKTIAGGRGVNRFLKLIGRPVSDLKIPLDKNQQNFVVNSVLDKEVKISNDLNNFTKNVLDERVTATAKFLTGTRSCIAIPIISRDNAIGALFFSKKTEDNFQYELPLLKLVSDQIGIAIVNAKLFTERNEQIHSLTEKNKELQSLYNLTSRVSQSLDPNEVAQIAVDSLPQDEFMIGGILSMLDEPKEKIYTRALTRNQISESVEKIIGTIDQYYIDYNDERFAGSPLVQAIKQAKPIFTNNIESFLNPPIPKTFIPAVKKILNIKSLAVFPIFIKGDLLGGLTFFLKNQTAEEISQNTHSLLQTYTYQIAIALDNARLYRQTIEIQASLQNALGQLQEARRKEKDMVDIMGHELRTPMSIVKNALAMLHMYTQKNQPISYDKLKKYVDIGIESARRETNLIETLLSATKADAKGFQLTLEKVDLLDVINDSLVAFNTQAKKKGLDIIYNKDENQQLFIYADRIRIQEVIDNFLSNAVKYTNKGYIKIYLEDKDDLYWIHIEDTGFGIGEEDLKNLGRKFYRAQQHLKNDKDGVIRPGGTGLGLYVSFALVKIMNGKYKVQSTLGKGSRFSFGMPKFVGQETTQVERKVMDYAKTTEGE